MKIAIIGANGQLGTDLCKLIHNAEIIPLTHADIEITDAASVKTVLTKHKPEIIINTASYVRVDDCEDNQDKAYQVNALGACNVARAAQELDAKLVHISTDYVFGGDTTRQTPYTEMDIPAPINIYGASKLAGEEFVRQYCQQYIIVRMSGLFGTSGSSGKGGNFVETMLRLGKERPELRVVSDQVFSPTYTLDAAGKIAQLINTDNFGIFHVTNRGTCSWYEFTKEILRLAGLPARVISITSDQYPQKAKRPGYSVLGHYRLRLLGMDDLRSWREAIKKYMEKKDINIQ